MKRFCAGFAVLIAAVGLTACGSGSSSTATTSNKGPITLGFAIGESGFMAAFDLPARTAAKFAVADINAKGGIGGRQIKVISANMKSKPELAGDAATAVINKGADIVVTSCDFDNGSPAAIVAQSAKKLAFSTCAASTSFGPSGVGPLAFTMATAASAEGATMAEWGYKEKAWRSAYTLLDNTISFDKESAFGFTQRWKQLGGDLVGADTFKQSDQSIAAQINKIKALSPQPDAIYLASYMPGEASALKQLRAAGLKMPILADEDIDGDYWKAAVPGASNVYYSTYASIYGDDPDPAVNALVKRYVTQEGKIPDTAAFITGYAMVQAIQAASTAAGGSTDGVTLQKQLETFTNKKLILPTTFNATTHISFKRTLRIMQIQNGKTSLVTTYAPVVVPVPKG